MFEHYDWKLIPQAVECFEDLIPRLQAIHASGDTDDVKNGQLEALFAT